MKKMKKALAVILSLAMVLGMSLTTFADENTPNPAPAKVNGVYVENPEATVEAYQIITYNTKGYYEVVPALKNWITTTTPTNGDMPTIKPSSSDIQNLYYNYLYVVKQGQKASFTKATEADGFASYECADLGLGTWMVVVTSPSGKYLYNPAIISVSQMPGGQDYGVLNLATDSWQDEDGVYLKRDEPTITKKAEAAERSVDGQATDTNVVGTQYGDILKYTITADIPAYTKDRTEITYKITDTIKGLDYVVDDSHPVKVTVGGKDDTEADVAEVQSKFENAMKTPATVSEATSTTPAVKQVVVDDFGDVFLTKHANEKIIITYYARVTSTILINVDRLNNKAELDYSNNNTNDTDEKTGHEETETKHYTFGIDVAANGLGPNQDKTGEFVKIDDQGNVKYTETFGEVTWKDTVGSFLKGAEFQLRVGSADDNAPIFTDKSGKSTFTTDTNGRLSIAGLDDGVDYYLVETKAPQGYTLNDKKIKVHITATYVNDPKTGKQDVLKSYVVKLNDNDDTTGETIAVTNYNYNVTTGETTFLNTADTPSNPYGFRNTKLSNLPSTGGIGTTIFTIGGCAIMIIAAALFFASRRKAVK